MTKIETVNILYHILIKDILYCTNLPMKKHLIACYVGLICLEEIQLIACFIPLICLEEIHLIAQQ